MEWVQRGSLLRQEDLDVFKFWEMESHIFSVKSPDGKVTPLLEKLGSEKDWDEWLDKQPEHIESYQSGVTLLIGGRAKPRISGMEVAYLPFSKSVCTRVVQVFQIHRSISRVINRNTTATFSTVAPKDHCMNPPTFVYNCRSSSAWSNDLALSVTYYPHNKTTLAMLYGCCESTRAKFIDRLSSCDFTTYHPLTLSTIFAEVERNRHFDILNPLIAELVNIVEGGDVTSAEEVASDQSSQATQAPQHYMKLWLEISWLKNGLEDWRQQLDKMVSYCDELRRAEFHIIDHDFESSTGSTPVNTKLSVDPFDKGELTITPSDELADLEDSGNRIQQKLLELKGEYDEKIRACATIIDGMVLAAQLEWNKMGRADMKINTTISKSSLEIAEESKKDGQRMRSIAVLTMIFLPATFVATVFSMTFFNWSPEQGQKIMSPYIWIYIAGTAILTGLTLALLYLYSRREKKVNYKSDTERLSTYE
ncbi:hypothetical protein F5884DRAFT_854565 [Xylogone sp. PMI_703]|nr:hypothetical protein F5884DRAFT_854565 [Xylogone sp. PMI_703]